MTYLQRFSVARFTYVPNEYYDTIEAAFAAKPLADWIAIVPHAQLSLAIENTCDKILMKCFDGEDVRSTWDLSTIKNDSEDHPSRRVVIVKFPHIVFRWYNRQEKILRRIQFKLIHSHEFAALTRFCTGHFGAVRDLYSPGGGCSISISSGDSNENIERRRSSGTMLANDSSPVALGLLPSARIVSSQMTPPTSTSNWIPKSAQPRSLTKMLADAERKANMVHNLPQSQSAPQAKDNDMVKVTSGNQPREIAERIIGRIEGGAEEHPRVTESILLGWIQDDSFMAEVAQIAELWSNMGMDKRLFSRDV